MSERENPQFRERMLREIHTMLNSPTGEYFVEELRVLWDGTSDLFDPDPLRLAHRVGLRDAFKFVEYLQTYDGDNHE